MVRRQSGPGRRGERLRVAVLMGGPSSEHDISLQGGANVAAVLDSERYEIRCVVIGREGRWRLAPRPLKPSGPAFDPHRTEGFREVPDALAALEELKAWGTDVVVPVLHGRFGEDGLLQACLAVAGLPFVGTGSRGSALASDKVRTKEVLAYHGIRTPAFERLDARTLRRGRADLAERLVADYGAPLVIKDPQGGSSLEVRIADDVSTTAAALGDLAPPAEELMVEAYVAGRELTAGVLHARDRDEPVALPIVEIRPRAARSFDFREKYSPDGAEELCPAPLEEAVEAEARALALRIHRLLGLHGISRTDLILDEAGDLHVLEVNTFPGMTERGLVPLAARAAGIDFEELIETLVRTAAIR